MTEIFEQFTQRDEIQSMLNPALIRILQHVVHVREQCRHGGHVHGVVIEHPRQRTRVAETLEEAPSEYIEAIDEKGTIGRDRLQEQCQHYLTALGIQEADLLSSSYSDILLKQTTA